MELRSPERLIADRYALHATQRRGRAGVVWRATDMVTGGPVAVEEIEPPAEPEAERAERWSRIVEGARTAAVIDHPGALRLHDVLLDGERLYVVTELVEALSLDELLERHGRLPPRRVARIGLDVLDVLEAVHRAGFVHLDLQPANVLVTTDGAARVAGIGLAAVAPPARPMPVPAPEQVRGEPAGPPADLWALGAVMRAAVEGKPPGGEAPAAGPLAPLVEALLAGSPGLRPAAAEVRRQLQEVSDSPGGTSSGGQESTPPLLARTPGGRAATAVLTPVAAATSVVGRAPLGRAARGTARRARSGPGRPSSWRQAVDWLLDPRRRGLLIGATSVLLALLSFAAIVMMIGNPTGSGVQRQAQVATTAPAVSTSVAATTSSSTVTTTPPTTAAAPPAGWTVFADASVGYRMAYPASWEVVQQSDHQTEFHDRSVPTFLRVEWRDQPAGDPVAAEQQSSRQHATLHEGSYQQVRVGPAVFQGRPAAVLEFTYLDEDQEPCRAMELGGDTAPGPSGPGRWLAISVFARESDWGVAQSILQTALASFAPPAG
jgi:hypothetical protein